MSFVGDLIVALDQDHFALPRGLEAGTVDQQGLRLLLVRILKNGARGTPFAAETHENQAGTIGQAEDRRIGLAEMGKAGPADPHSLGLQPGLGGAFQQDAVRDIAVVEDVVMKQLLDGKVHAMTARDGDETGEGGGAI